MKLENGSTKNVFFYSFTIGDLPSQFVVSLEIVVCFGEDACVINQTILTYFRLPKDNCSWDKPFWNPGIYDKGFLQSYGVDIAIIECILQYFLHQDLNRVGTSDHLMKFTFTLFVTCSAGYTHFSRAPDLTCYSQARGREFIISLSIVVCFGEGNSVFVQI